MLNDINDIYELFLQNLKVKTLTVTELSVVKIWHFGVLSETKSILNRLYFYKNK